MSKLSEALKQIGVEDESKLPGKIKLLIDHYNRILKSKLPSVIDDDGNFKPKAKEKLQHYSEVIITEAKIWVKEQNQEEKKIETKIENQEKNSQTKKEEKSKEESKQEEKKGFWEGFWDW